MTQTIEELKQETEFCWSCRQKKPKDQINAEQGSFYFGICNDCISDLKEALNRENAQLIFRDRKPQYSMWHSAEVTIKDVFLQRGNDEFFIRGFHTCDPAWETSEVFDLVKQFIESNFKSIKFYGNLETLKTHDFWFYVSKTDQFYHIGGNCHDISNAFSLKTTEIIEIWKYIEIWTKMPDSLKVRIEKELAKPSLSFCSSTEPFDRQKQFCFKDYSQNYRTPKIMPLKNFSSMNHEVQP